MKSGPWDKVVGCRQMKTRDRELRMIQNQWITTLLGITVSGPICLCCLRQRKLEEKIPNFLRRHKYEKIWLPLLPPLEWIEKSKFWDLATLDLSIVPQPKVTRFLDLSSPPDYLWDSIANENGQTQGVKFALNLWANNLPFVALSIIKSLAHCVVYSLTLKRVPLKLVTTIIHIFFPLKKLSPQRIHWIQGENESWRTGKTLLWLRHLKLHSKKRFLLPGQKVVTRENQIGQIRSTWTQICFFYGQSTPALKPINSVMLFEKSNSKIYFLASRIPWSSEIFPSPFFPL